ncbi:MAG TPA: hypothetical protein VF384_04940 [Planctomycetota bacterium]
MSRPRSVWLALLCASLVPAQDNTAQADALASTKQKLAAALQKTAGLHDTGYRASWGVDKKKKGAQNAMEFAFGGGSSTGNVQGSWHADRQHFVFDNDTNDELVAAGGRSIAKDDQRDWRLRTGRFADGNKTGFLPDVPLLLQQLATWDLAVVQRTPGALEDRPVEVISVSLNAEQVGEAIWSGLLPESLVTPAGGVMFAMGGGNARPVAPTPAATVDLAVTIDPATSLVHQIQFRAWNKENARGGAIGGNVFVVRAGGGVAVQGANDDDDDEEEDEKDAKEAGKADAPLTYENGLPVRARKKTTVMDYTVRVLEHGSKQAPALSDAQKKLLGR